MLRIACMLGYHRGHDIHPLLIQKGEHTYEWGKVTICPYCLAEKVTKD